MPRRAKTNPKRAVVLARRMSIGSVIVTPTPTAAPLIAPITGLVHSKIRSVTRPPPSRGTPTGVATSDPPLANVSPPPDRSAPAQIRASRPGHDHGPDIVVGVGEIERRDHLAHHRAGERVQLLGTVQRDRRDPVADVVRGSA